MTDDHAKEYSLLPFAICQEWQLQVGYERSFKLSQGRLLANRYLIGIPTANLPLERAREFARRLGMPQLDEKIFWQLYAKANLLLIGFEHSEPGCVYKFYLEFDDQPIIRGSALEGKEPFAQIQSARSIEPQLLHRGIKWNVSGTVGYRISDYLWHRGLDTQRILDRVKLMTGTMSIDQAIFGLLDRALKLVDGQHLRYLEVDEDCRRSFDVNLYAAGLTVGAVLDSVRLASETLMVDPETVDQIAAIVVDRPLGHLAAGRDSQGNEFLTVYYEPSS